MSGRFLLDTNIVIALFANEAAVREQLTTADEVFIPMIVIGELYYGARKSERSQENIARVDQFAASAAVLDCTTVTARIYGEIKDRLRAKGRALPENDIWIAAVALHHQLVLVTRDRHFEEVDNITLAAW